MCLHSNVIVEFSDVRFRFEAVVFEVQSVGLGTLGLIT